MRKLGIGKGEKKKKQKGDKDERSDKEMKADLKMGIQEATAFVEGGETDKKKIKKKFDKIEKKYDLVELKLVVDKENPEGVESVHVHGEVNPEFDGDKFTIEMEDGKVELPPDGYAYFLRQHSPMRHFKVVTASGLLVDLTGFDGKAKIKVNNKAFSNAFDKKGNKTLKKVVELEIPGEGKKENFIALKVKRSDMTKGEMEDKVDKYNGAPYSFGNPYTEKQQKKVSDQPIDCFKFAVDLLNDILVMHDDMRLLPNERKEKEGEEKTRDNDDRFNDILPNIFGTIKRKEK